MSVMNAPFGGPPMVEALNLAKAFDEGEKKRIVFRDLCAQFNPSQTTVIIGRSGTGKSTLLNVLSGIDLPDSGTVLVNGMDMGVVRDRQRTLFRRREVGFVFQFFNLIPTLTVEENLLLPLELLRRDREASREDINSMLERVGLDDRRHSYPDRLSGGEQQRIAIARALIHQPSLVLADEPTGNLDTETGIDVLQLLGEMTRSSGRTLIIVSHSEEVVDVADRVLRLVDGQLVEQG